MEEQLEISKSEYNMNYARQFGKINICHSICFLNSPNMKLLPQIEEWCRKNNCKIEETSFHGSIRIAGPVTFNFKKHLEVLELFSL